MRDPIRIYGAPGSPYSRKMRSLMRYRRIPYLWYQRTHGRDQGFPPVPVDLIPVLVFPDANHQYSESMIDSTFQIRRLEEIFDERSVVPDDHALRFVDRLIEDYADEWLTKAMFHYRWAFRADVDKAAAVLPRWSQLTGPDQAIAPLSKAFSQRQIGRLGVVGSNETTAPIIEESFRRFLRALDGVLELRPFVLGTRPGAGDFGIYGQMSQLALFEQTSAAIVLEEAPRIYAWTELCEDLSGVEGTWLARAEIGDSLRELLGEVGRYYAPFLLANAAALAAGSDRVECEIAGHPWSQKAFPYQAKCLRWLREDHAALSSEDRAFVDGLLAGSGCEILFPS